MLDVDKKSAIFTPVFLFTQIFAGWTWKTLFCFRCVVSNSVGVADESSGVLRVTHRPHVINTEGQSIYAADLGSQVSKAL